MLEQLDLAQGAFGQDLLAEDIGDLFNGHALIGSGIGGSTVVFVVSREGVGVWWDMCGAAYQTIPYAPWPTSLVTVYRSSTMKS